MKSQVPLFIPVFVFVMTLLALYFVPVMKGEDAFFGVRVSSETYFGPGRRILRNYRIWLVLTFMEILVIGVVAWFLTGPSALIRLITVFLPLVAGVLLYTVFYRQVRGFALVEEAERFASSLKTRKLSDYTSVAFEVTLGALLVAPVIALAYFYPMLPERIPVHWNLHWEPDRWVARSFGAVFGLPAMAIYMQSLLLMIKRDILHAKMTLPAEHTEEFLRLKEASLKANVRLIDWSRLVIAIILGGVSVGVILAMIDWLKPLQPVLLGVIIAASAASVLASAYYLYRMVMINRELKLATGRVYVQRKTDAAHWYGGGQIYYNPDDPTLFVEKLLGYGYTINLGNKRAYLYVVVIAGAPILVRWLMSSMK